MGLGDLKVAPTEYTGARRVVAVRGNARVGEMRIPEMSKRSEPCPA